MNDIQKTILEPVSISGKGLHTGANVTMTFLPASENHGFKFKRIDIEGQPILDADLSLVTDTSRGTVLQLGDIRISTIEHTMAALIASDLDNVLIELDGPEAPIMDGSSIKIMNALKKAGLKNQEAPREYFEIKEKITYTDTEKGIEIIALPDDDFRLNVLISFDSVVLGNQFASLDNITDFEKEIAPCRTFVFVRELEMLLQHNLVKGGDLDNAIVIMDKKMKQEDLNRIASLFNQDNIDADKIGILNNLDLHFNNEPARHKLLDVIGDLALVGKRIKGRIIATRPGHHANTEFGKLIMKEICKEEQKNKIPQYDPKAKPLFDIYDIKKMLPHRYPFLLIDKIIEKRDNYIVGVKNITFNEPFFQGHFPEEPVMPGVLLIEAMAQCGGIYVLSNHPDKKFGTYFMKMDNIKFRKKVIPGDTVIFKLELLGEVRRGVAHMKGYAYVGNSLVAEGEFMAQIVEIK
ncbi:bifunctional UDP-3-O-[3-hydroxymyristoyl] N-acetylglucosamine deacetylase/3-hydroxyacyl-ACP dehydratase [Halosquirtibacter xylanolyticus]|uniref:bifunctional UDP-3-O-[3-hydroxymyristoyl] N-acetylglucosamine deacetylase/3-hydroxyacyl-ACP dehydratase n=1 Tax=Halosquirtibacter xylanolyticus TaxID=3374599 RepID=UPI003749F6E3|nr:bifunctional UDP-3-O-[3-hydroxymyristoyl] N-acetylglucosamine deacetylase/3-hydroxyacyl-ACP dehydratase [Prolixibacteraceae bacterium]